MPALVKVQCSLPCLFSLVAGWKLLNSITGCYLASMTLAKPWCVTAIEHWHWLQNHAYQRTSLVKSWVLTECTDWTCFAVCLVKQHCALDVHRVTSIPHCSLIKLPCMRNALVDEICVWVQHGDHSSWVWQTIFRYACTLYTFHVILSQMRVWSKSCNCHTKIAI